MGFDTKKRNLHLKCNTFIDGGWTFDLSAGEDMGSGLAGCFAVLWSIPSIRSIQSIPSQ
jgi:hypothetical protein